MRAAEHAPRGPCRFLKCICSLAEIVERGAGVPHSPRERDTKFYVMSLRERFAYAELMEGNLREALAIYEQLDRLARRTFGASHPFAKQVQDYLGVIRKRLSGSPAPR